MLLTLLLSGATLCSVAQPPAAQGKGVKMPDSYWSFFPSAVRNNSVKTTGNIVSTVNGTVNGTVNDRFVPRPSLAGAPLRAAANSTDADANIYGFLYYYQGNSLQRGMYKVGATGTSFMWADKYTSDMSMPMTAGWLRDGKLCGLNSMNIMGGTLVYAQVEIDLLSGQVYSFTPLTIDGMNRQNVYVSVAYRDYDDRVYGYGYIASGEGFAFNSAAASDIDTSETIIDVPFEEVCPSLCYNVQDDMFYGVTTQGKFVSVDSEGTQEELFDLAIKDLSSTSTGLVYSPKDKCYIFNAYKTDGSSAMYAIYPETREVKLLYGCPYGEEYIYMVCSDDNAAPAAPARPVLDSYEFVDAALSGTATFTMPDKAMDGINLAGQLEWRFYVDGNLAHTGSAAAGSKATVEISEVFNGNHAFAFTAGVDGNFSMPVTFHHWVGSDYPVAPANVVLTETTLNWDAVTESVHGGYMDAAAITYTVTLNGAKVAETSETHCDITLPQGEPYFVYTANVVATADSKKSEPGVSNHIAYGEPLVIAPSIHYRPEEYEFDLFKAIDIDGKTDSEGNTRNWHYSETMGFPSFASGADGDDLLVFPPMAFTNTEKAYRFEMEVGLISDIDNTGTVEVLLGTAPTPEAMTQVIMPATRHYHMRGDIVSEYFAVKEAGTYYIGIRTKTNKVAFHVSDMDISLTDRAADVPTAPTDIKVTPGENGALTATATFTMPTKTANGSDIPAGTEMTATVTSYEYILDKPGEGTVGGTKTISGTPGSIQTVEVETQQNYNFIGIACAIDGRKGSEVYELVYTGLVKPYIVQNLKQEVSEDNMSVKLTWTPPVEADDDSNGPIGDTFFYSVWYYADGWQFLDGVGYDVLEANVSLEDGTPQQTVMLGVMAMNAAGQSEHISGLSTVIGTPYTLPMNETFPNYEETYSPIAIQRPSNEYNGSFWMVDDPSSVSPIFANDSKVAYIGYIDENQVSSAKSRLSFPKFSTEGVENVKFTLTYWGGRFSATYTILAGKYGSTAPVKVGDLPAGSGWVTNSIDIPAEFFGEKWVELFLDNYYANTNTFSLFSGYTISGVSGIEGVTADGEGRIFSTPGMLHVAGFTGKSLIVTDMSGRTLVSETSLEDIAGYALRPGIYVVKAGDTARKVVVK